VPRVAHVELLVEELSMEATLRLLLPRILGADGPTFQIHTHLGKANLLRNLPGRLRAHSKWLPDDWRVFVVVDRDEEDCRDLKECLEVAARSAHLCTRTDSGAVCQVVNRIAVEELEAWFFGDMPAVRSAFPRVSPTVEGRAPFRNPDAIRGGTWEALERILKRAGYFAGGLQKIAVADAVGRHMDPARNTSPSFRHFRDALLELTR